MQTQPGTKPLPCLPKATVRPATREKKEGQICRQVSQSNRCRARENMTPRSIGLKLAPKLSLETEVGGLNLPLSGFFAQWCSSFWTPLRCSISADFVR
jgi:hypothetical protein